MGRGSGTFNVVFLLWNQLNGSFAIILIFERV